MNKSSISAFFEKNILELAVFKIVTTRSYQVLAGSDCPACVLYPLQESITTSGLGAFSTQTRSLNFAADVVIAITLPKQDAYEELYQLSGVIESKILSQVRLEAHPDFAVDTTSLEFKIENTENGLIGICHLVFLCTYLQEI